MPELPEVENICKSLQKCVGKTIQNCFYSNKKLRNPIDENDLMQLIDCKIVSITRKAKYLLFELNNNLHIVSHLGMSGKFILYNNNNFLQLDDKTKKHHHINLYLNDDSVLCYDDTRRFGMFHVIKSYNLNNLSFINSIPMDAIDINFNAKYLFDTLKNKKIAIKQALLDQSIVGGIGNIYASEALFSAKINPTSSCQSLNFKQCELLVDSIKEILNIAINQGGSTLKDYKKSDGSIGNFQNYFKVYGKQNSPCVNNCKGFIEKIVQNTRATFFCKNCQK
jgi:formamidopyrimidine-DNA glycosylase